MTPDELKYDHLTPEQQKAMVDDRLRSLEQQHYAAVLDGKTAASNEDAAAKKSRQDRLADIERQLKALRAELK
jgi:ABC-type phosphate transport system auxiliary subunit